MAKYPGTEFQIGDKKIVVPALTLGMLRNGALAILQEHDKLLEDGKFLEALDKRGMIILQAIRRNYTEGELSDVEFWAGIDMANVRDIWQVVTGVSGIGVGEATPAMETGTSGAITPPSPAPTVGQ